jgi:hypothetical protein
MIQKPRVHYSAAIAAALSLSLQPFVSTMTAAMQGQAPAKPAATSAPPAPKASTPQAPAPTAAGTAKPATTSAASTPIDGGWPRVFTLASGGSILVYQPQISSWEAQKHMVAFSAVSYRAPGAEKPVLGTFKLESNTGVSVADRLVKLEKIKISEANFQTLPKDQVREISSAFEKSLPDTEMVLALDRILANLDKSQVIPKNKEGVKADPPAIFFSKTPAVLMNLDGDPIWSPIKENDLKYAVNTVVAGVGRCSPPTVTSRPNECDSGSAMITRRRCST